MSDASDAASRQAPVVVTPLADADVATVIGLLDDAQHVRGDAPAVDEAEQLRLDALRRTGDRADRWHPMAARTGDRLVGYAAAVVDGDAAVGDAAVAPDVHDRSAVLSASLDTLAHVATTAGAQRIEVWIRRATDRDAAAAATVGFDVVRRLAILGRDLATGSPAPPTPAGITIRAARPATDDAAIVEVLAGAYGDGPDGGWDLPRLRARQQLDWFRHEDLLVAVDEDGRILGLHWLKRRSATVGEVYNLAIHPDGQGRGLGPTLLHAGLGHLTDIGCEEVLLWVDRANERAVRLYTSEGMTTRWDDVALGRDLTPPGGAR